MKENLHPMKYSCKVQLWIPSFPFPPLGIPPPLSSFRLLSLVIKPICYPNLFLSSYGAIETGGEMTRKMVDIAHAIQEGANAFLLAEYGVISVFMVIFAVLIGVLLPEDSWATSASFVWGAVTSLLCGYIGMKVAVQANVRTAKEALHGIADSAEEHDHEHSGHVDSLLHDLSEGYARAFNAAFFGGAVMGFALVSLGVCNLFILIFVMERFFPNPSER